MGQGPGEYRSIYDAQIDEKNNRIYLMPWQTDRLLVFDMQGKALDPIPLGIHCPKAKFRVDPDKGILTVAVLPFPNTAAIIWTQDLTGKHINELAPGHLGVPWTFNNEVSYNKNLPGVFDFSLLCIDPTRADSLYHYDAENNRLRPTFTFNHTTTDPIPWHGSYEWPDHFTGQYSGPPVIQQVDGRGVFVPGETFHYIIDKKTCKGAYFKIYNDYLGDQNVGGASMIFYNGYYTRNIEPGNLQNELEELLKKSDLSDEMRKKLTDMQNSIDPDDNNYLLIYKLKR